MYDFLRYSIRRIQSHAETTPVKHPFLAISAVLLILLLYEYSLHWYIGNSDWDIFQWLKKKHIAHDKRDMTAMILYALVDLFPTMSLGLAIGGFAFRGHKGVVFLVAFFLSAVLSYNIILFEGLIPQLADEFRQMTIFKMNGMILRSSFVNGLMTSVCANFAANIQRRRAFYGRKLPSKPYPFPNE